MADMSAKKSTTWLWTIVLVAIIVILFWLWKSGTLGGTMNNDGTPATGPKVTICVNNGGTWNEDTDSCDMPEGEDDDADAPSIVETGAVDPLLDTGADAADDIEVDEEDEIDITASGDIVVE